MSARLDFVRLSFRAHVVLLLSAAFSLLAATYGLIILPELERSTLASALARLQARADSLAVEIDRELRGVNATIERIAALPSVASMQRPALDATLGVIEKAQKDFIDLAVLDVDGTVVARPSKPERVGENRSDQEYFRVSRARQETWIESAGVSTSGNLSISVGTPIRSADGAFVGVLRGSLGFVDRNRWMYRAIVEASVSEGLTIMLADENDVLIASSDTPIERSRGISGLSKSGDPIFARIARHGHGTFEITGEGADRVVATANVPTARWKVALSADKATLSMPANQVAKDLSRNLGILGLTSFVALLLIANHLTTPLAILTTALRRYGEDGRAAAVKEHGGRDVRAALAAFNAMIAEREVFNAQLLAAKERAESASLAKSHLLANVSHELRTPLTAILGFRDLLAQDRGATQEERAHWLAVIERHGNELLALINDLLDASALSARSFPLHVRACDIGAEIREAALGLEALAQKKGIALAIDIPHDGPRTFTTDPTRVRQIVVNVVGNAIKFTEQGSVTITVDFANDAPTLRKVVRMRIVDTGVGIDPQDVARIFRPFEQGDSSASRQRGGTGLGLSLARDLASLLGGNVTLVKTSPHGGTEFLVVIREMAINPREDG